MLCNACLQEDTPSIIGRPERYGSFTGRRNSSWIVTFTCWIVQSPYQPTRVLNIRSHWSPWSHHDIKSWLVASTPLKNMSQWEGLSPILWKIKHVWNHQWEFHDLNQSTIMIPWKFTVWLAKSQHAALPPGDPTCRFQSGRQGQSHHSTWKPGFFQGAWSTSVKWWFFSYPYANHGAGIFSYMTGWCLG